MPHCPPYLDSLSLPGAPRRQKRGAGERKVSPSPQNHPPRPAARRAGGAPTGRTREPAELERERAEGVALSSLARGDGRTAFELLAAAQSDAVFAFCLRIVKNVAAAEDVRQKVLLLAYRGLSTFAGASSLRTWLLGIAKHCSFDAVRAARREARAFAPDDLAYEVAALAPAPDELLERARAADALRRCLGRCASAEEIYLIRLRYQEGLSYETMGALLGKKPDSLRARVARTLVKLRRRLERQGAAPLPPC